MYALRYFRLVSHDQKLYAMGGMLRGGVPQSTIDMFDPSRNAGHGAWGLLKEVHLQSPLSGFGCVIVGSRIIAIGGVSYAGAFRNVSALNLRTKQWDHVPSLATPRESFRATVLNGLVYAIGGYNGLAADKHKRLRTVEVYAVADYNGHTTLET